MLVKITNRCSLLGLIGSPVAHSLSPAIHNFMLGKLGLDYIYLPFDVESGEAKRFLEAAPLMGITGFNVTMPHKQDVFTAAATTLGDARESGSVNTAVYRDGKWNGYSTDGEGFTLSLTERDVCMTGKRLLVMGAGGAARAVVIAAKKQKALSIRILGRTKKKVETLAQAMNVTGGELRPESLREEFSRADILINATPLGMTGTTSDFEEFSFLDTAPKVVCDLIYSPLRTKLLQRAESRGHVTIGGLGMLIYQAILSLELFTGQPISATAMRKDVESHLIESGALPCG